MTRSSAIDLSKFASTVKAWRPKGKKRNDGEHTARMYGEGSKAKRDTSSAAIPTKRQGK